MAQQNRIGTTHTTVQHTPSGITVVYHSTPVVVTSGDEIPLNTGGYFTATTKTRMNQASNQFKLGYYVFQSKGEWYCRYKDITRKFEGTKLILKR
jgi:hypothetical protein